MSTKPRYVSSIDIARASGVSVRTVRRLLASELPQDQGERSYRFSPHEMPRLVEKVISLRKRRRSNVYNREVAQ